MNTLSNHRICFFADGQSVHTARWCRYFADQGNEVHLITFRETDIPGVIVHFINCGTIDVAGNNKKFLLKIPHIRKIIKAINPDIIHALYATSYGLAASLCGKKPLVVTALGSDVLISPFQNLLYKIILKFVFRKASWITAMSDPMKEVMIRLKATPEKLSTVIFGIDSKIFNSENRTEEVSPFTIISTRNFEPVYNIDVLIKSLAIARPHFPDMQVHLVGTGTMKDALMELIEESGLQEIIKVHGKISQLQIADLLRQSQLFVSVSSSDGNNISLNEAMACGCFSVVSDIPANRVWIKDGINGYFCKQITEHEVADSILKAYRNYKEKKLQALKYNETIIREKALWSVNMKKVEYIYSKLLGHEK